MSDSVSVNGNLVDTELVAKGDDGASVHRQVVIAAEVGVLNGIKESLDNLVRITMLQNRLIAEMAGISSYDENEEV